MKTASASLLALLIALALPAVAHEVRPGYLELRQVGDQSYRLLWKAPVAGAATVPLHPVFSAGCRIGRGEAQPSPGAVVWNTTLRCDGGLRGKTLVIEGLDAAVTDVLVRVHHRDGIEETHLLRPDSPSITFGGTQGSFTRAGAYLWLGIQHILLGLDHLLFIFGLLLIVGRNWMLVKTITSFTIAHSITLAVATLGYASAPLMPLNASIALSILFLGPEIARRWKGQTSFTIGHPWIIAFAFGLLHGFGFASGLTRMGLPRAEIPLALLLFNVGVEIGQIFFLLLVLALQRSFVVLQVRWPRWVHYAPGYLVGGLGAFWTLQRTFLLVETLRW